MEAQAVNHVELAALEAGVGHVRAAPASDGRVELIVARPAEGERLVLEEAELDAHSGLVGDTWRERRIAKHGEADPDTQLTLMNARAAALFAGPREQWAFAGDQLYLDLDVSEENLPPGTRLSLGDAVIEITAYPHTGCGKFLKRFGMDASKFLKSEAGRELRLRGIYARVVQPGTIRAGDTVTKL